MQLSFIKHNVSFLRNLQNVTLEKLTDVNISGYISMLLVNVPALALQFGVPPKTAVDARPGEVSAAYTLGLDGQQPYRVSLTFCHTISFGIMISYNRTFLCFQVSDLE